MARTLRACTAEQRHPLEQVSWYDLKRYGATPRHRFHDKLLWVEVDLTHAYWCAGGGQRAHLDGAQSA